MKIFYDIQINDILGKVLDLHQFKGKKVLIVNVASECGYTPQYEQLEELNRTFGQHLRILGCPCNDFGGQEPGDSQQIFHFCQSMYGVSFTLTEKLHIKSQPHPLFQFLMNKTQNGIGDFEVEWNFHKFLIDEEGLLYKSLSSSTEPLANEIVNWVQTQ